MPLLLPSEWQDDAIKEVMKVDPVLIRDFNSYRENTRYKRQIPEGYAPQTICYFTSAGGNAVWDVERL